MSKTTEQQTQDIGGDNLMDALNTFNAEASPPESEAPDAEELTSEASQPEPDVKAEAETSVETDEVETTETDKEPAWLIESKFKDDDDGKHKLAEAYRNMQSMKDKAEGELRERNERYEKLAELDTWLKQNPEMVKMMQGEVQRQDAQAEEPPAKPEDYDIYEESIDGSSSAEWRRKHDDWLMEQGAKRAISYVDQRRAEDRQLASQRAEVDALKAIGMSEDEIKQFYGFMNDPKNVTPQNMVEVWKRLDPQAQTEAKDAESDNETSEGNVKKAMAKVPNAGAVDGKSAPVQSAQNKQEEEWWTGIMANSR